MSIDYKTGLTNFALCLYASARVIELHETNPTPQSLENVNNASIILEEAARVAQLALNNDTNQETNAYKDMFRKMLETYN